jgi:hypothetical protein
MQIRPIGACTRRKFIVALLYAIFVWLIFFKLRWLPSYRFYRAWPQLKSPMRYICEIFGAPRFSSFSTQSTQRGHRPVASDVGRYHFLLAVRSQSC